MATSPRQADNGGMILPGGALVPLTLALSLAMVGCAALPPKPEDVGTQISTFTDKYGSPSAIIEGPSGRRLVYRTGPFGEETYFVDADPNGLVKVWQQVLTEENFKKIQPNMPAQAVYDLLGPCSDTFSLARNRGSVCSYRYHSPFCQWFSIEITAEGFVRSADYLPDPRCDDKRFKPFRFGF